jgi:deazaflavin-dependent oxidoreductase (nitroreductase family)
MPESPVELNWEQLNALTAEVIAEDGPGSGSWRADASHTRRFNDALIAEFRASGGNVAGELGAVDLLLLTTTGAKTGRSLTVPLSYYTVDGRTVVIASMGGARRNPPWLYNIRADPGVTVEVGADRYAASAVETQGEDRDHLFAEVCARMPVFAEYQERTERLIPVVELTRRPETW